VGLLGPARPPERQHSEHTGGEQDEGAGFGDEAKTEHPEGCEGLTALGRDGDGCDELQRAAIPGGGAREGERAMGEAGPRNHDRGTARGLHGKALRGHSP